MAMGIVVAFAVVAGLALVLRWTFGSDLPSDQARHERTDQAGSSATPTARPTSTAGSGSRALPRAHPAGRRAARAAGTEDDRFGLLRTVTVVADAAAAEPLREVLSDAGIRSTTGAGRNGGVRVLVFEQDLDRARRLTGSAQ